MPWCQRFLTLKIHQNDNHQINNRAFTGYRAAKILAPSQNPLTLQTLQELQNKIINDIIPVIENLYSQGYRTFLSGMSDGFDMWAASAVLKVRASHQDINLIAVIPFLGQEKYYSPQDKNSYNNILSQAQHQIVISQSASKKAYLDRNDFMLSNASHIICYYDGKPGGTMYTFNRAKQQGLSISNIKK